MKQQNKELPIHKIEQFEKNITILEELAKPQPKIELLRNFRGFGGLSQVFWQHNLYGQLMRSIRANFGAENEQKIMESLKSSASSAYFTPPEIVKFIYRYLEQVCNFTGGDILEPSCGSGVFFEHMPASIKANSTIIGVEYDILTSKLVKAIYPDITIINQGLQDVDFAGKKYDLIIGNPPYGGNKVEDLSMPDISGYTIHHYFTAKCVRLLKDNGILAFVLPSFYMDIPRRNTRHIIDSEAVVIDVIRLPENLFTQATITVDILLLRKTGNKIHDISNAVWHSKDGHGDHINQYWIDNPKRIFGRLKFKWVECYHRYVPTCETSKKKRLFDILTNCTFSEQLKAKFQKICEIPEQIPDTLPQNNYVFMSRFMQII